MPTSWPMYTTRNSDGTLFVWHRGQLVMKRRRPRGCGTLVFDHWGRPWRPSDPPAERGR